MTGGRGCLANAAASIQAVNRAHPLLARADSTLGTMPAARRATALVISNAETCLPRRQQRRQIDGPLLVPRLAACENAGSVKEDRDLSHARIVKIADAGTAATLSRTRNPAATGGSMRCAVLVGSTDADPLSPSLGQEERQSGSSARTMAAVAEDHRAAALHLIQGDVRCGGRSRAGLDEARGVDSGARCPARTWHGASILIACEDAPESPVFAPVSIFSGRGQRVRPPET